MAKTVNYTPEMTTAIVADYVAADTDEARADSVARMAEKFGKGVASIRQKLVREGVYQKAAKVSKDGAPVVSKAALVAQIAKACDVAVEDFDSLEKATKNVLLTLVENFSD